jgi:uncharacterized protein
MRMQVRLIIVLLTVLLVTGCPGPQPRPGDDPGDTVTAAELLAERGREGAAARLLEQRAAAARGIQASRLHLRAAELWLTAGELDESRMQIGRVDLRLLDESESMRARLLRARLALADDRPGDALGLLPARIETLEPQDAEEVLLVRAMAQQALGNHRDALVALVARDRLLRDDEAKIENQEHIWNLLRRMDPGDAGEAEPALAGWLELAALRQLAWNDPAAFERALREWRSKYPAHPANARFVPRLVSQQRRVASGVSDIALILPLSGRFGNAAAAVRDGLLAAYYRSETSQRPRITIYDTGDDIDATVSMYRQAVEDGADFVIGPLQKEAVAALAQLSDLPVPVLALNTLDQGDGPQGMYQFGLVPEDEAEQIAERIAFEGMERGVALIPDNDLGIRLLRSFQQRYEELGGVLLATEFYNPGEQDHSAPIVRSLAIDESRSRQQTLRSVLNINLQTEPRRRRDAEFVFVVATPQHGRALRPQLRFHHATDLPVFASSHLFTGTADSRMDADMDGIAFTDMPWTIGPDPATSRVKEELQQHFGGALERNTRLYALGYDAYRLAPVLKLDPDLLGEAVPAATGALRLDADGRIHRTLSWAHFRGGVPVLVRQLDIEDLP